MNAFIPLAQPGLQRPECGAQHTPSKAAATPGVMGPPPPFPGCTLNWVRVPLSRSRSRACELGCYRRARRGGFVRRRGAAARPPGTRALSPASESLVGPPKPAGCRDAGVLDSDPRIIASWPLVYFCFVSPGGPGRYTQFLVTLHRSLHLSGPHFSLL